MKYQEYLFATPFYALSVDLRLKVLLAPLGFSFTAERLSNEWKDIHLGAFNHYDQLLGCLVLSPANNLLVKMRQVAVREVLQGRGIGTGLVGFAEEYLRIRGYAEIVLSARIPAVAFYERMGYIKQEEEYQEAGIPHQKMSRKI